MVRRRHFCRKMRGVSAVIMQIQVQGTAFENLFADALKFQLGAGVECLH